MLQRSLVPVLVGVVAAVVAVGRPSSAAACGDALARAIRDGAREAPAVWLGTPEGVTVPAAGVMYRSVAGMAQAVRYEAAGAAHVDIVEVEGRAVRFAVDAGWQAPAAAPRALTMRRSIASVGQVGCEGEDALAIQLDQPVAAVRVFWASGGERHERILAPRPLVAAGGGPAAELVLGRVACAGEVVPVAHLQQGVVLGLTAIRHDGSEVPIDKVPTMVDLDEVPTVAGRIRALAVLGRVPAGARPAVPGRPAAPAWAGVLPLVLIGGAVAVGARRGRAAAAADEVLPPAKARRRR
jgi:hypothetical protein